MTRRQLVWAGAVAVALGGASSGCHSTTAPQVSAPEALPGAAATADAIWVTRSVDLVLGDPEAAETTHRTVTGLFACYRKAAEAPGPPDCYLARYVWNAADLGWPGSVSMSRSGNLSQVGAPAPAAK